MDLTQLEYFLAVARTEHFARAADELNVSQSTISMALGKLEDELGVQLFSKSGRRKYLTPTGTIFKTNIEQAMKFLQLARVEAQTMEHIQQKTIWIDTDSIEALTPGETEFLKRSPEFSIRQFSSTTDNVVSSLKNQRVDFAITHTSIPDEQIVSTPLLHERVGLLMHANHPLAKEKRIRLADLEDESFISLQAMTSYWNMMEGFFRYAGYAPKIALEALDMHMLYQATANKIGVAFLSDGGWHQNMVLHKHPLREQLTIVPLEDSICTRTFYISTLRDRQLSSSAWYMYIFLCEYYMGIEKNQREFREQFGWV